MRSEGLTTSSPDEAGTVLPYLDETLAQQPWAEHTRCSCSDEIAGALAGLSSGSLAQVQVGRIKLRCPDKFIPGLNDQGLAAQGDDPVAAHLL